MVRRVNVRRRIVANHLDNDVSKPKTARHDQQPVLIHNVGEHRAMEMGRTCCRGGPGQGRAGRPEHWWWVTYPLTIHDKQSNAANLGSASVTYEGHRVFLTKTSVIVVVDRMPPLWCATSEEDLRLDAPLQNPSKVLLFRATRSQRIVTVTPTTSG